VGHSTDESNQVQCCMILCNLLLPFTSNSWVVSTTRDQCSCSHFNHGGCKHNLISRFYDISHYIIQYCATQTFHYTKISTFCHNQYRHLFGKK